jgi:Peptidase M50B-like
MISATTGRPTRLDRVSVVGEPVVYVSGFVVLLLLAFARPWAEGLIRLVQLGGLAVAAVLIGYGVRNLRLRESTTGPPGGQIGLEHPPDALAKLLIGSIGLLAPPALGLLGLQLVLAGQAWSLLLVVLVLLFAAYLKALDLFTIVVVLLAGAGIALATAQRPAVQTAVAVGVVWWLLLGGVSTLFGLNRRPAQPGAADPGTSAFIIGPLLPLLWIVSVLALWVGARRLLGL